MDRQEALEKLISVRHHCFVRGVLRDEGDFRMAFRDVNRLYVQLRDQGRERPVKKSRIPRPKIGANGMMEERPRCKLCNRQVPLMRVKSDFCSSRCNRRFRRLRPQPAQPSFLDSASH